ncbi:MAG: hypothetical protein JO212_05335 [Acetobacteraceae bacterium]|nr:hypothetical protein [Acetobacteraceae bacterium]
MERAKKMQFDSNSVGKREKLRVLFTQQTDLLEIAVGERNGRLFSVATCRHAAETVTRRMAEAAD